MTPATSGTDARRRTADDATAPAATGPATAPPGGRTPWAWWKRRSRRLRIFVVVGMVVPTLLLIAAAGIFYAMTKVPLPQSINTAQVSTVTYRDGKTVILKIGSVNRTNVPLSAVSLDAQHAVLAAEDKNFYSESGISCDRHPAGAVGRRPRARRPGRLDHHPAVREERVPLVGSAPSPAS